MPHESLVYSQAFAIREADRLPLACGAAHLRRRLVVAIGTIVIALVVTPLAAAGVDTATATDGSSPPSASQEAPVRLRKATPVELQRLAEKTAFQRGQFVREALGMSLTIPREMHLLAGADARKADMALRGEDDPQLIGWMTDVHKTLTDSPLRPIRIRWRHDGLVPLNPAPFDPQQLLEAARTQARVPRLSGSEGQLVGYDSAPVREDSLVFWSEERRPDGAKAGVHDCHVLRLARKGVLELSIVGVDALTAKTCLTELRTLAASVRFMPKQDYPAVPGGEPKAAYSLGALIAQTQ
ncbi:MAG: hypothetical protein JSR65_02950 [Proteobacteria bacterium]|nr:hypothetical protein [Pseudomonadota bacterium]